MKGFSEKTQPATSAQAIDSKQVIRQECLRRRVREKKRGTKKLDRL